MLWIFLALLAPFIWAIGNQIDVYLIDTIQEHDSSDTHGVGALIIVSCFVAITVIPIIAIIDPSVFSVFLHDKLLLIAIGIIEGLAILAYLYALQEDDAASITAWFNSIPLFTLILGFFILGERISTIEFVGFIITLTGLIILSFKKDEFGLIFKKKIALLMIGASIALSLTTVLFKDITPIDSFWVASFWQYTGLLLLGGFFFVAIPRYRISFLSIFRKRAGAFYALNITNEILFVAGSMVANYAALLAPVAIVALLGSFLPLIVLVMGIGIAMVTKKQRITFTKQERITQVIGIILTIIGMLFIL